MENLPVWFWFIIFIFTQIVDAYTTKRVLDRGTGKEVNKFIQWLIVEFNRKYGLFGPKIVAICTLILISLGIYIYLPLVYLNYMKAFLLFGSFMYVAVDISNYFIYLKPRK